MNMEKHYPDEIRFEDIYARAAELLGYSEDELKATIGEPDREFPSKDGREKYFVYSQLDFGLSLNLGAGVIVGMVCPYEPDEDKVRQGYYDVLGVKIGDTVDRVSQMWGPPSEVYNDLLVYSTNLGTTTAGDKYYVELSIVDGRLSQFNCMLVAPKNQKSKGGCFIATACYGDYNAEEVLVLRNFRDHVLLKNRAGRMAVSAYYLVSPSMAKLLEKSGPLKVFVRNKILSPVVAKLKENQR